MKSLCLWLKNYVFLAKKAHLFVGKSRFWLMKSLKSTLLHHVSSICAFRDMDRVTSISGPSATTEPGPITTIGGRIEQVESHCLLNDATVNDTLWIPLVYKNSLTLKINHFEWKRIVQPLSGRVYVNLLEWIWEAKAVIFAEPFLEMWR